LEVQAEKDCKGSLEQGVEPRAQQGEGLRKLKYWVVSIFFVSQWS